MNDYKELIRSLRKGHVIGFNDDGFPVMHFPSELEKIAADAIEQLAKERDAAIADLKEYASCDYCKHSNSECKEFWEIGECGLHGLCGGERFEWRGVTDDN